MDEVRWEELLTVVNDYAYASTPSTQVAAFDDIVRWVEGYQQPPDPDSDPKLHRFVDKGDASPWCKVCEFHGLEHDGERSRG